MAQPTTHPPETPERRFRMSREDYLAWVDDSTHSEWVDGEVTVFMPPDEDHQDAASFLFMLVRLYVGLRRLGKVLFAPFEMRLRAGRSYREPDLLFVATEHFDRLDGQRLNGPADLAIEILSDDSVTRDRREKFVEYAAEGIPEYWLVDPRPGRRAFAAYRLTGAGAYQEIAPDERGRLHSGVLSGFWLDPAWLTMEPLPDPDEVILDIAGEDYLAKITAAYEARRQGVR